MLVCVLNTDSSLMVCESVSPFVSVCVCLGVCWCVCVCACLRVCVLNTDSGRLVCESVPQFVSVCVCVWLILALRLEMSKWFAGSKSSVPTLILAWLQKSVVKSVFWQ